MPKRTADDNDDKVLSKKAKHDSDGGESNDEDAELKKDSEGNHYLDLGGNKRATVSVFKGRAQMNIREYYTDRSTGDLRPGKKGITLNSAQWSTLVSALGPLTERLNAAEEGKAEGPPPKKETKKKLTKEKKIKSSEEEDE